MAVKCPVCGSGDVVQRLSVVVAAGESSSSLSGSSVGAAYGGGWAVGIGFTSLSGSANTRLAGLLAAPVVPAKEEGTRGLIALGCLLALPFVAFVVLFIMGLVLGEGAGVFDAGMKVATSVVGAVSELVIVGLAAWLVAYIRRDWVRRGEKYAAELEAWETAARKWEGAYFCFRDGVVFDPETGESCPLERAESFLYGRS